MSISFNQVPSAHRTPFWFVEFDNTAAVKGPTLLAYKALMLGQKLSGGTATANVPVTVTSAKQAETLFGAGSMLSHMCDRWFDNNKQTGLTIIPLDDNASGVAASGTLTFAGTATTAGSINLYVNGRLLSVAVEVGDTPTEIASNVKAAINAETTFPISGGALSDGELTYAFKHKGLAGNEIDVRINLTAEEEYPGAVSCTIVAPSGGTLNPVLTSAISAMGDEQYNIIAFPYTDSTSMTAIEGELTERWGPSRPLDGLAVTAKSAAHGSLLTFGETRNSPFVTCFGMYKHPDSPYEYAAGKAALIAFYGNIDPARPFQTLEQAGALAPALEDRFTMEERNLLLFSGIATSFVDGGGKVRIERAITMYRENALGATDVSYLDVNTILTNSYLRYDFRAYFARKYPRHKLADDTYRVPPGQAVITPKVAKAECIALYSGWLELGLVENMDAFKASLVVERNITDRNRLDFLLSPDLMNQLVVGAARFAFIL